MQLPVFDKGDDIKGVDNTGRWRIPNDNSLSVL